MLYLILITVFLRNTTHTATIELQEMIMKKSFLEAEKIFQEHHGILRSGQAKQYGIDTKTITDMYNAGILERLGRGLYRLYTLPPLHYPDLVQVAIKVPKAVICLLSALAFHNLTTEIPQKIHIALPQSVRQPRFAYPPLDIVWLSEVPYTAGIEKHQLDGVEVSIYAASKTVADCFKFRNKIGKTVAIEALKTYVKSADADFNELLYHARINRVETVLRPYLEAVL